MKYERGLAVAAFVCLLSLFDGESVAHGESDPSLPSRETIVQELGARAFLRASGSSEEYLVKWSGPIHVGIVADKGTPPQIFEALRNNLAEIQRDTKQSITITGQGVNFLVILSQDLDADLTKFGQQVAPFFIGGEPYQSFFSQYKAAHWTCGNKILLTKDFSIAGYLLVVSISDDHKPRDVAACAHRGLMKGMGLLEQKSGGRDAFSFADSDSEFSPLEKILLRVLYDPELPAGTPKSSVLKQISERYPDRYEDKP